MTLPDEVYYYYYYKTWLTFGADGRTAPLPAGHRVIDTLHAMSSPDTTVVHVLIEAPWHAPSEGTVEYRKIPDYGDDR